MSVSRLLGGGKRLVRNHIHMNIRTYVLTYIHTYIPHTYIHAYIYYLYTYIHIMCVQASGSGSVPSRSLLTL
jgi:hypothetical protein